MAKPPPDLDAARRRWTALFPDADPDGRARALEALLDAYTGPDRHYHGLAHILDSLATLDEVRPLAEDPRAVELAIWFHDVVYDAARGDNESRSAGVAVDVLRHLGEPAARVDAVRELILDTRHVTPPHTPDGRLMVDIDLAGLAAPPSAFDENTGLIRREYPHIADAAFREGRAEFLRRMLGRPRVYHTDALRDRYEARARANLARAIGRLTEG